MLANLWAVPSQPYSRHEKRCWRSRATRSTITRLPSGSPVSRSTSFRSGVFGLRSRYCPPLHVARWRHFVASPLRQSRFVRRKLAHPSAYASAWLGSEYLPSSPAPASTPVCPIPPLSTSPAPRLMLLVRPRYSSIRFFVRIGASESACTDCEQWSTFRPCLAQRECDSKARCKANWQTLNGNDHA